MTVKFTVRGVPEIVAFLKELPRGSRIVVLREIVTYLIGDERHGLRHEPAYKHVTRRAAYGEAFSSDKQRRWFFANLDSLNVGQNNRTHAIQSGWQMRETDSDWRRVKITNDADGVGWVFGEEQARLPKKVGWRKAATVISTNITGALQAGQRALAAWLAEHGR